ncbi:hypothetical protein B0H19DRAFT_1264517 [Mycena capillaripes]|nr:hypothetical protein B0H19DRAFT_1264517 [Mycena capillaripes]
MPPEIIAEIFGNFLPNYPGFPPQSGILSPLVLCQICQRWREIAISTPALWNAVAIALTEDENHEAEKLESFKTWIEHLRDPEFTSPPTLFERAPRLRSVVLLPCFLTSTIRLPWAQLTHIDAHCLYEHECTDILRDARCLISCTASVCCSDDDVVIGPAVPAHTNLRDLKLLVDDSNVRLWMVLDCLTLPALRTLQVPGPCVTIESLTAFVGRSHCELEELSVTNAALNESRFFREALSSVGVIKLDQTVAL